MDYLKLKYNGIHHQFPLNYTSYIFYFPAVWYSILHVLLTLYGLLFKIFDKRDDFNFPIVNFPLISSNISAAPAYGVYISQLIRYSIACGSYQDFLKLKSSLQRFTVATLWNISVTVDHGYVPLVVNTSRSFPRS